MVVLVLAAGLGFAFVLPFLASAQNRVVQFDNFDSQDFAPLRLRTGTTSPSLVPALVVRAGEPPLKTYRMP